MKLHSLSHAVEFHAKAALALHQKSNPVAHHVVKHFQHQKEAHAKGEKPHKKHLVKAMKKIQKVASSNLTKVQVARQLVGLQIVSLNASFRRIFNSFNWCFFQHVKNHSEWPGMAQRCQAAQDR